MNKALSFVHLGALSKVNSKIKNRETPEEAN